MSTTFRKLDLFTRFSALLALACMFIAQVQPISAQSTNPVWTLSEPPQTYGGYTWPWWSVAISADGSELIAGYLTPLLPSPGGLPGQINYTYDGQIYRSTDGGTSWAIVSALSEAGGDWYTVASSADGSKLYASGWYMPVCESTNSGASWSSVEAGRGGCSYLQTSADGTKVLMTDTLYEPTISYFSTNSGSSWIGIQDAIPNYLSPDGNSLFIYGGGGISRMAATNYPNLWLPPSVWPPNTWIPCSLSAQINSLASSYDGSRLVAVGAGIYTSADSGQTWITNSAPSTNSWSSVVSSWDGMKIIVLGAAGLYSSWDGGNTWVSNSTPVAMSQIVCSSNATTMAGIGAGGAIYISQNSVITTAPPEAPMSAPQIVGTSFSCTCTLVPGHTYQAQCINSLASKNWGNLGGTFVATNNSMVISDAITNSTRFYRVKFVQ